MQIATWRLPEGHKSVAAFAYQGEAERHAQELVAASATLDMAYYITDKRGSYEVIAYPRGELAG